MRVFFGVVFLYVLCVRVVFTVVVLCSSVRVCFGFCFCIVFNVVLCLVVADSSFQSGCCFLLVFSCVCLVRALSCFVFFLVPLSCLFLFLFGLYASGCI